MLMKQVLFPLILQKFISLYFAVGINFNPPGRWLGPEYVSAHQFCIGFILFCHGGE